MPTDDLVTRLARLLARVNLGLETTDAGFVVTYEKERHPVAALPLDDLDAAAVEAELMAVAAGLDAAVKTPGELAPGEPLEEGAATLLPRIERRRFLAAYDAVLDGRGDDGALRLYHRDFGDDLVVCYVQDGGWRFSWVVEGRFDAWGTSHDTVHSLARSNLYAREALDFRATSVAQGDGYDAARVVLIDDVFYDRVGADGVTVALPSRDQLLIGPDLDPAAVAAACAAADYPLSPHVARYYRGTIRRDTA